MFWTVTELAKRYNVTPTLVWGWVGQSRIPCHRTQDGRAIFDQTMVEGIDKWRAQQLEKQRQNKTANRSGSVTETAA